MVVDGDIIHFGCFDCFFYLRVFPGEFLDPSGNQGATLHSFLEGIQMRLTDKYRPQRRVCSRHVLCGQLIKQSIDQSNARELLESAECRFLKSCELFLIFYCSHFVLPIYLSN